MLQLEVLPGDIWAPGSPNDSDSLAGGLRAGAWPGLDRSSPRVLGSPGSTQVPYSGAALASPAQTAGRRGAEPRSPREVAGERSRAW